MEQTIYAQVTLIPVNFPNKITVEYRVADPVTNEHADKAHRWEETWDRVRKIPFITKAEWDEREAYLRTGEAANCGFHYITGDFE